MSAGRDERTSEQTQVNLSLTREPAPASRPPREVATYHDTSKDL